jgi:hypothetical protein
MSKTDQKEVDRDINEKIDKLWAEFEELTRIFSNILRQLAFAEGAIFWIFKLEAKNASLLSVITFFGLMFLVFFFFADAMQYYLGKKDHECWAQSCEDKKQWCKVLSEYDKPQSVNNRNEICFDMKIFFISISSLILIFEFVMIVFFKKCIT